MKKIFFIISFLISLIPSALQAQTFPDYGERDSIAIGDTSAFISPFTITATEGSIDPDIYTLGPGDKVFISISGLEEIVLTLIINQEGNLYIPKVGGIDLTNSTLSDGKEKIIEEINKYYKNVDVFVSLADFRKIKVSLLGNVKKPSTQILTANSRLMDLISNSRGLVITSNFRNIKIVARTGEEKTYDLLSYLRFGNKTENPYLLEGDAVVVDKIDKIVSIYGEVKYPAIYEYAEGETVLELINLAGGFTLKARKDTIEVVSFDEEGKNQISSYYSLNQLQNSPVNLKSQDRIIVRELQEYYLDRYVEVKGFVKYPGWYKIVKDSTTLKDVIQEAGGFLADASLTEASLTRATGEKQDDPELERIKLIERADMTEDEYDYLKARSRERPGKVVVDFEKLFLQNDLVENVILKRGDVIDVPEAKNYITLLGQVVKPGKVIFKKGLSIDDYIELAGGFGWRALDDEVRVVKANTGEWVEADEVDLLEPGDTIWILEDPPGPKFWDVFTTVLQVTGQIASVIAATAAVIIATR